jgi:predicted DNA-binding transcriptional regulator AlpA
MAGASPAAVLIGRNGLAQSRAIGGFMAKSTTARPGMNLPGMTDQNQPEPDPSAVYLSEREVARRTSLSTAWLQERRSLGGGPPWSRCGKRVVYKWSEVEAWIDAQKVTAPTAAQEATTP